MGKMSGSGGIRTHAPEETGALNQRLRPLGHATSWLVTYEKLAKLSSEKDSVAFLLNHIKLSDSQIEKILKNI